MRVDGSTTAAERLTVEALRNGDAGAFERLFAARFGRVKAFIFGYVKNEADAEDLAEEILDLLGEVVGEFEYTRTENIVAITTK